MCGVVPGVWCDSVGRLCGVSVCVCVCVCVKSVIYNKENDMTTASEPVRKRIV